jgi:hypothetical protein
MSNFDFNRYIQSLPEGKETIVKITRTENIHKDEWIYEFTLEDGTVVKDVGPKERMRGSKCKICGKRYHVCSSCDTWGIEYLNAGFCSSDCADKGK